MVEIIAFAFGIVAVHFVLAEFFMRRTHDAHLIQMPRLVHYEIDYAEVAEISNRYGLRPEEASLAGADAKSAEAKAAAERTAAKAAGAKA